MNDPTEPNALLLLGEIRGQLRELIHSANNNSQKLDALGIRVAALEADKNRREGALGLVEWLAKNWPVLLALGIAVVVALRSNGRLP